MIEKKDINNISIEKINKILKSYKKEELVPSAHAWELWISDFWNKVDLKNDIMKYVNRFRDYRFQNEKMTEEDFKRVFPELEYTQYVDPMSYNSFYISNDEINRIAMLLQEELNIEWLKATLLVKYTFRGNHWNYRGLYSVSGSVCSKLKSRLMIKGMAA